MTARPATPFGALRRRLARSLREAGQTLVEFALILPIMLLLIFALVDFGRGFYTWLILTNGAREGARVGATQQDYNAIVTRIQEATGTLDQDRLTITLTNVQGPRGEPIEVDLEYDFEFVTPIGGILNIVSGGNLDAPTITAHASMRLE